MFIKRAKMILRKSNEFFVFFELQKLSIKELQLFEFEKKLNFLESKILIK